MITLPFSETSNIWDEFELDGVLKVAPTAFEIEYEGSWTRFDDDAHATGLTEWKATSLAIPYQDIVSISLERTWVRTSFITLRTSSSAAFAGFPLAKGVLAEIPVSRRHRAEASDLVAEVSLRIAEASGRTVEGVPEWRVGGSLTYASPVLALGRAPLD
jgi:hypothetical protein